MPTDRFSRRAVVGAAGTGVLTLLAGCTATTTEGERQPTTRSPSETERNQSTTESEGDSAGDALYAFAPGAVAVIDLRAGEVVAEITDGLEGAEWGDAVPSVDNRRLFVNDSTNAQVVVFDAVERTIEERIDVGPGPVHMYRPRETELWTHSDEEGAFYVIDTAEAAVTDKVVAARGDTGHGKLTFHENLGTKAYATNTNDPGVHVLDLDSKEVTGFVETQPGGGTHAQRYNPVSDRAYFEGVGENPRTAAVDPSDDTVETHYDVTGHIYNSPDGRLVAWVDKGSDEVRVLDAETGEFTARIAVEGAPDKLYFHESDGTLYGFTANTNAPDTAVIDFDAMEVVERVEAGSIARPEGATLFHRGGLVASGYFVTPASGDGVVSIIDANERSLHAQVPVAEGVDGVAYVGPIG